MPAPKQVPWIWVAACFAACCALAVAWFWQTSASSLTARHEAPTCALPIEPKASLHPGMVGVPSGSFDFGDTQYPEEGPVQKVSLSGFWMDRTEVTNDAFAAFVKATSYVTVAEREVDAALHPQLPPDMQKPGAVVFVMPNDLNGNGQITQWWRYIPGANWRHPGGPNTSIEGRGAYPVVAVTHEDAMAYARWMGRTLPSEVQWEWAARAGKSERVSAQEQPQQANTWQGIFPVRNTADDGYVGLAPVGCYAANTLGLFDMVGNVWELTKDVYQPRHSKIQTAVADQPELPPVRSMKTATQVQRVIKGGSFLCAPNYCMRYRAGARQPQDEDLAASHLGFRTILVAPAP